MNLIIFSGSGYASAKVLQMAWHRIHNVRARLKEMEDSSSKHQKLVVPNIAQNN